MNESSPTSPRRDLAFLGLFGAAALLLHLPVLGRYGIHGDELYFLACGERLAAGYADHPPLVPALARLSRTLFGDSLFALRLLPCLAGAVTVVLAGLVARELGGRRFAQGLAALAVLVGPFFLRTANMLSIPSFEPLYWTGASLVLLRILKGGDPRLWLAFGAVAGVGLMNKHSMLLYGLGVVVGLAATRQRRHLAQRWIWLGGALALLVFLPNLIWQARHDWATARFLRALNENVMSGIPRAEFLAGQVIYAGAGSAPLWIAGLVALLRRREARVLGVAALVVFGVLLTTGSKVYYSMPLYPLLFGAGAAAWERWVAARPRRAPARPVLAGLVAVLGLVMLPISLPVVPLARVDGVARALTLGLVENSYEVTGDLHAMVGWREQAEGVARLVGELPPEDRAVCLLWATNYARAGALELHAAELDLPPVLCNHLSYHHWSRDYLAENAGGPRSGEVVLAVGFGREGLERLFEEVEPFGTVTGHPDANPWDRELGAMLCRWPKRPLVELWPERMNL